MSKARVRSMQRGAQKRDRTVVPAQELYKNAPPVLAQHEHQHFELGAISREAFVDGLRDFVRGCSRNGFRKPKDVARLLNKNNRYTACGEQWTPRLAWFLLSFMFEAEGKGTRANGQPKPRPAPQPAKAAATQAKLTDGEMARRLEALRRHWNS